MQYRACHKLTLAVCPSDITLVDVLDHTKKQEPNLRARAVGDDAVNHAVVNHARQRVLHVAERIKVAPGGHAVLCAEDGVRGVGPHDAWVQMISNQLKG